MSRLRYASGPDPAIDRPAHIRAGSGLAWAGTRLVVVQDDANFIALVNPDTGAAHALPLPAGEGGRRQFDDLIGNKAHKLDLEAVTAIPQPDSALLVIALGSGSTPRRELVATMRGLHESSGGTGDVTVDVRALPAFYAQLRDTRAFAGSELNVEAAVFLADAEPPALRLFNRGNGAARAGIAPVNATCDVSWSAFADLLAGPDATCPAPPSEVVKYELGDIGGLPLTFTDAAIVPVRPTSGARSIVYTAAAEASPDVTRDGPVAGCCIGIITERDDRFTARWTLLRDGAGAAFPGKVEGIALRSDDPMRGYVVVDRDAPGMPAELCEIALDGSWLD